LNDGFERKTAVIRETAAFTNDLSRDARLLWKSEETDLTAAASEDASVHVEICDDPGLPRLARLNSSEIAHFSKRG
jgi:hypothetical protein